MKYKLKKKTCLEVSQFFTWHSQTVPFLAHIQARGFLTMITVVWSPPSQTITLMSDDRQISNDHHGWSSDLRSSPRMIIALSYGPHGPTSTQDGLWGPTGLKLDWRCLRHNLVLFSHWSNQSVLRCHWSRRVGKGTGFKGQNRPPAWASPITLCCRSEENLLIFSIEHIQFLRFLLLPSAHIF